MSLSTYRTSTYKPSRYNWQGNLSEKQIDSTAREIIGKMSLRQKIWEMHGHGRLRLGFYLMMTGSIKPAGAGGKRSLQIPPTVFYDGPRGVSLKKGSTAFPVTMARGASWDRDLERQIGDAMAKEIRALGGNYSGAVCMNILRHPAWGRAQETYGEDPWHVGEMASALVSGIQEHNVQACIKHFAANSMENNRFGGSMNMDERTLREVYLPHFRKAVDSGAASIMSAYNKLNGEYCGHSKYLLKEILRDEWGFKGYVTSDWDNGLKDTEKGILAGMNVEMPDGVFYTYQKIKALIDQDKITEQHIDDLIFPIIRTKLLFASKKDKMVYPKELFGHPDHAKLAREVAEKSAVLLKNEEKLLPLDKKKIKTIAVIGSLADTQETGDHGSSWVKPPYVMSPLEGMQNYLGSDTDVLTAEPTNLEQVKNVCEKADVVLVVAGMTYRDEGEYIGEGRLRDRNNPDQGNFVTDKGLLALGGDRKYLHLHQQDIDIIKAANTTNGKVIVSLIAGAAITVEEWIDETPTVIQTFYNGMEGGNALARLLFGDVSPSGKLPFTVPRLETDLPPFDSFLKEVEYGYYHGYTLFDKESKSARYPFGFGLSYTTFEFTDLNVKTPAIHSSDLLEVEVKVKNTGERDGAEVVQLYIGFSNSSIDRPVKLLRGFEKVYLNAGEEQVVSFSVKPEDLAFYDTINKKWQVENMTHEVFVGNSSISNRLLKDKFEVEGF